VHHVGHHADPVSHLRPLGRPEPGQAQEAARRRFGRPTRVCHTRTSREECRMIRIDGLPADETARLNALVKQIKAKQPRNELRTALMNHKRTFENWPLVNEMGDLKAVLGWPAKGVETLARRCRLEG